MGNNLGVCFRAEYMSFSDEFRFQGLVVFNNAVMHYNEVIFAGPMGMGVFTGRRTMSYNFV